MKKKRKLHVATPDDLADVAQIARTAEHLRRAQARQGRSLPHRLAQAVARATSLATASAMALETKTSHGKVESMPPPACDPFDLEPLLRPIRIGIEELERALDAETGHATGKDYAQMISEEKDREILTRFVGVKSVVVSQMVPELGSPRTIERVRQRAGKRPVDGKERAA